MDIEVSKDKHVSRWADQQNFIYVRWNKNYIKSKKVIDRGKRNKTLNEVEPVGNISKNLQSFLEISPLQKEIFFLHGT